MSNFFAGQAARQNRPAPARKQAVMLRTPQKIVINAGSYSETRNNIEEALHVIKHLLQAGQITIEIENVSAKIEDAGNYDQHPEWIQR